MHNSATVNVLLEPDILITLVLVEWRSLARHLPRISTAIDLERLIDK